MIGLVNGLQHTQIVEFRGFPGMCLIVSRRRMEEKGELQVHEVGER